MYRRKEIEHGLNLWWLTDHSRELVRAVRIRIGSRRGVVGISGDGSIWGCNFCHIHSLL